MQTVLRGKLSQRAHAFASSVGSNGGLQAVQMGV